MDRRDISCPALTRPQALSDGVRVWLSALQHRLLEHVDVVSVRCHAAHCLYQVSPPHLTSFPPPPPSLVLCPSCAMCLRHSRHTPPAFKPLRSAPPRPAPLPPTTKQAGYSKIDHGTRLAHRRFCARHRCTSRRTSWPTDKRHPHQQLPSAYDQNDMCL